MNLSLAGFLTGSSVVGGVSEVEVGVILDCFSGRSGATHRDGRRVPIRLGGLSVRGARVSGRFRDVAVQRRRPIAQCLFVMGVEIDQTRKRALSIEAA